MRIKKTNPTFWKRWVMGLRTSQNWHSKLSRLEFFPHWAHSWHLGKFTELETYSLWLLRAHSLMVFNYWGKAIDFLNFEANFEAHPTKFFLKNWGNLWFSLFWGKKLHFKAKRWKNTYWGFFYLRYLVQYKVLNISSDSSNIMWSVIF